MSVNTVVFEPNLKINLLGLIRILHNLISENYYYNINLDNFFINLVGTSLEEENIFI